MSSSSGSSATCSAANGIGGTPGARRRGVITTTGSCPSSPEDPGVALRDPGHDRDDRDAPGLAPLASDRRACGPDRFVDVGEPLREVVARTSQRARAPCGRTASGSRQVERGSSSCGSTPGTRTRHLEAEHLVGAQLDASSSLPAVRRAASCASPGSACAGPRRTGRLSNRCSRATHPLRARRVSPPRRPGVHRHNISA